MSNPLKLRGAVVVVTGAGGGIGRALVPRLLAEGAQVVATDFDEGALKSELAESAAKHGRLTAIAHDVRDAEAWRKVIAAAEGLGGIDALVNLAGVLRTGYIADCALADIDFHFDVNVKGLILGSKLAAEKMIPRGRGRIVNVASLAGVAPIPGIALYSASKFAVRGFTLALAQELKPHNVHVAVVCPDAVQTAMLDVQKDKAEAALTFSGTVLSADEVAAAIAATITNDELEVLLPWNRGLMAKLGNFSPRLAGLLVETLTKEGLKNQAKYK